MSTQKTFITSTVNCDGKKTKIQQMGTGKKGKKTLIGLVGLIFSDGK